MSSTRNQLVSLLNTKVITGGRNTTAQKVRDFENAIISSLVNLVDDANVNGGYLQINNSGYVNVSFIKAAAPSGQFLRDDGTWQTPSLTGITNGLQFVTPGVVGLGSNLTQNTVVHGGGSYSLFIGHSANNYIYSQLNYNEIAHTTQNIFTSPLHQFAGTNFTTNLTGVVDINTDNGVYSTPSLYLDPTNNYWDVGSSQAFFLGQLTQVDYIGQYFNMNATQIMPQLVPNRALYLDASKFIKSSSVTDTELGYLSGTVSNIQTQINNINAGLSWKVAVRIATTANITLSGLQSIDGVTTNSGDRILVKDQSTGSQNGIYIAASGTWSRSTDCSTGGSTSGSTSILGATVVIEEGTVNADTIYTCSTNAPITIGVTSITFIKTSATTYSAGTNITLTSNTFSLASTITGTVVWNAASISTTYTDAKIKGAATTGQLLYASATDTAATSANVAWDNSNLRLNVGQASGASAIGTLMVKTTGTNTGIQVHGTLGGTFLSWHDGSTSAYRLAQNLDASSNWIVYRATGSAGSETFTEAMRIVNSSGRSVFNAPIGLKSYTVSTLPTGVQGDVAFVTDATAPTYLGVLVGGGTISTPVFYNGSAWVSF